MFSTQSMEKLTGMMMGMKDYINSVYSGANMPETFVYDKYLQSYTSTSNFARLVGTHKTMDDRVESPNP